MFPIVLDAYEFASDELKAQLDGARSSVTATEEAADKATKRQKRDEVYFIPTSACYVNPFWVSKANAQSR